MSGKKAKKQKAANRVQTAANDKAQRASDLKYIKSENIRTGYEYDANRERALQEAELAAGAAVTKERSQGIRNSETLLSNFGNQERNRLMKARQGTNQVDASDTAITAEMVQGAKDFRAKGADFWDAKRGSARSGARSKAASLFDKANGTREAYIGKGLGAQKKQEMSDWDKIIQDRRDNPGKYLGRA